MKDLGTGNRDAALEANDTFTVMLGTPESANAVLNGAKSAGTGTITNDDQVSVTIDNVTGTEPANGNTKDFTFTATLSSAAEVDVVVGERGDEIEAKSVGISRVNVVHRVPSVWTMRKSGQSSCRNVAARSICVGRRRPSSRSDPRAPNHVPRRLVRRRFSMSAKTTSKLQRANGLPPGWRPM